MLNTYNGGASPNTLADPYQETENPRAQSALPAHIAAKLLGGYAFNEAFPNGFITQSPIGKDRLFVGFDATKAFNNDIDSMEIRSTEFGGVLIAVFMRGSVQCVAACKEANRLPGVTDIDTLFADMDERTGYSSAPEERRAGGLVIVSKFVGLRMEDLIDLVRSQTGVAINADPDWDQSRIGYRQHVETCACENCVGIMQDIATLKARIPDLLPIQEPATAAKVVQFASPANVLMTKPVAGSERTVAVVEFDNSVSAERIAEALKRSSLATMLSSAKH